MSLLVNAVPLFLRMREQNFLLLMRQKSLRQHRIIGNKKSLRIEQYEMQRFSLYFYSQGRTELGCQTLPVSQIQIRQCEHHI